MTQLLDEFSSDGYLTFSAAFGTSIFTASTILCAASTFVCTACAFVLAVRIVACTASAVICAVSTVVCTASAVTFTVSTVVSITILKFCLSILNGRTLKFTCGLCCLYNVISEVWRLL